MQHVKQTPPTPMQSTVNLLQDEPEESCNPVPASSSSSSTATVNKQTTSESRRDQDQIVTTSSQSSSRFPRSQPTTHMKKKSTTASSSKGEEMDTYWETEVTPLLRDLDESTADIARLCELSGTLWICLEGRGLLGRTGGEAGTKRRAAVLRSLFRLLDHTDSHLLLRIARIILAVSASVPRASSQNIAVGGGDVDYPGC